MADTAPVEVMGVAISNPDKPVWRGAGDGAPVTKLDLARYFEAAGGWILPHIAGRPCSILRAPDGVGGPAFFQRHPGHAASPLFDTVRMDADHEPYLVFNTPQALVALAQIGGIELHPTGCAPDGPDIPGRLVFDFDPDEALGFGAVVEAALEVRERLAVIGLIGFCRTTGGQGLHVVVPLKAGNLGWEAAKALSRKVCDQMAADWPERYVATAAKTLCKGRIFLDYLCNDRLSTAIAPLSPRARPGAPVAMPLNWSQVTPALDPAAFTVRTAPALIAASGAWAGYDASAGALADALGRLK